jgi:transposase-like protein
MNYPSTQKEFENFFSDEGKCLSYIFDIKHSNEFTCVNCSSKNYWLIKNRIIRCKNCRKDTSLTAGTIFHSTNLTLMDLFRVMWWMVIQKNGVSAKGLGRILGIDYKTAWVWLHKFRRVMVIPERSKLKGNVEIDEMLVGGKKKGKRGRGAEGKALVVIAVEVFDTGTGRIRLAVIADGSRKSLNAFIKQNVERNSTITTDAWKGYVDITKMKYFHNVINLTKELDEDNLLPNVHLIASLVKRWLLGTHQSYLNRGHLQYYLDEFVFRHNRRKSSSRGRLFYSLIYHAIRNEPILNIELLKKNI